MEVSAILPMISPVCPLSATPFRSDPFCFSPPVSPSRAPAGSPNCATATECKLVEVRGLKVASFSVDGQELICLPQVFELFLKHLVGGLHTVYTKLKRLRARPVVCTVEQVRVLRGVGAIQPGVNRCKLISRTDFEALYNDCTSASSRPGRPPKRAYRTNMQKSSQILQRSPGLLPAAVLPPKDLPFKMMSHSLLPVNLPRTPVALVMNHLNTMANMVNSSRLQNSNSKPMSVIKAFVLLQQKECSEDKPSVASIVDGMTVSRINYSHKQKSSPSSSPKYTYIHSPQSASLNTSEEQRERESGCTRFSMDAVEKNSVQALVTGFPAAFLYTDSLSVETLLTNIQGLLKVALENARVQENQLQQERRDLKLELYREREIRENLERQLTTELHSRATIQRRLKKEKKEKRRLQEALQFEFRRREQVEQAFQHSASHIFPHDHIDAVGMDVEVEHIRAPEENHTLQETNVCKKNTESTEK
ncbi:dachshund b isoform X2 [Salminus brasiliensis]|uniref:dachshund b isoform X2 n=1 Tax=Salminus brasiliensis TaxID=930266 RepID=UPI003B83220A